MCNKVRYFSRKFAKFQLKQTYGQHSGMNAYKCECGWWHIGHATMKHKQRLRTHGL